MAADRSVRPWWLWAGGFGLAAVLFALAAGPVMEFLRPAIHKDIVNRYAGVYKFDPLFVMALIQVESGFQPAARSRRGAIGLMQLMPETAMEMARRTGLSDNVRLEDLENPETNIRLGFHYLSLLREEFKDDRVSILAAYNAGPRNVRVWRKSGPLTVENIPYGETRRFVGKVLAAHQWMKRFQKVKNVVHV